MVAIRQILETIDKLKIAKPENTLLSFTGVVGRKFPFEKIKGQFSTLIKDFYNAPENDLSFAKAIMTTDSRPKKGSITLKFGRKEVRLAGASKGAGMIHPNMATMLCYVTTDIEIDNKTLHTLQKKSLQLSFNSITVDGDTSTNDSFFIFASGKSGVKYSELTEKQKLDFENALNQLSLHLAHEIVRDGEGATRFVTIDVKGTKTKEDAQLIASAVSKSLLVKTAIFGHDPNYGRVLVAMGYSGANFDPQKVKLHFGKILLFAKNEVLDKNVGAVAEYLNNNKDIVISLTCAEGSESWTNYTCDISYEYVKINAEYTT